MTGIDMNETFPSTTPDFGGDAAPPSEPTPPPFGLTPRELEVATLMVNGDDGHEIAKALGFSIKTYDTHRHHILKKAQCKNTVQLVHAMWRAGLLHFAREV